MTEEMAEHGDACGMYLPRQQVILLSNNLTATEEAETLIHEIIEAANSIYELDMPHTVIQSLAVVLQQALSPALDFEKLPL